MPAVSSAANVVSLSTPPRSSGFVRHASFREFWPGYVADHADARSRWLHLAGTTSFVIITIGCGVTSPLTFVPALAVALGLVWAAFATEARRNTAPWLGLALFAATCGHPLFLAGKEITEMDFWVPQSGGVGVGISILSYAGKVQFGLITDAGLGPDPENIINRFADEFEMLVLSTLMGPYGPEFEDDLEAAFGEPGNQSPAPTNSPDPAKPTLIRTRKTPAVLAKRP